MLVIVMKRIFGNEGDLGEESNGPFAPQLKRQRPMLSSAMREVMGVQCMQRHLPKLETFIRRVVQEEVGNALCRFINSAPRLPINRIQTGHSRQYRLHFQNCLPQTLFTGSKIEAEGRVPLQIAIMNTESNKNVTSGPLASAKIEILVLDGDFGGDDQMEWTEKEFGDSVVHERDGKRPLLTGELVITLNNGVGYLGDAAFTDNSSWIRSRKFRLGARLLQSKCTDVSIKEAIGGPFFVKDHRGELYRKHHPPSLDDEVWRLEKIGKDGAFHKRLADNGINTVQEFLKNLVIDQDRLRSLLGMSNKIWEATLEHAKECVLDDKYYSYCDGQGVMLLFNSIFQLVGAMFDHTYHPLDDLTASQKVQVNKLKQLACKNSEQIVELNLPLIETLPKSLPSSDAVPVPQASCSEPQNLPLPAPFQAAQVTVLRQPSPPCNELLDPLQLRDYLTGQGFHPGQYLGPSQANNFNMRDFLGMQFGDIPTVGLSGPIITGDHLAGYNSEIDMLNSLSPLPGWDHGNGFVHASSTDSRGGLISRVTGTGGSPISSGKWAKLVAALKLMAVSKHLAANRDTDAGQGYPVLASSMSDARGGWFSDEG